MEKIRVGIVGYGNIGKGVEKAVAASPDMELAAVFTRRDPSAIAILTPSAKVLPMEALSGMKGQLDVLALCGGSATDLPEQGPTLARNFTVVDSFDTHARIPGYYKIMNECAKHTVAIISAGWDPGLFSMMRMLSGAVLPDGETYTFWGRGVSQGHSDAIRRVEGVMDAVQYTIPVGSAIQAVRGGGRPALSTGQKHTRECYVAAADGADKARIERDIKAMPNYFVDYDTTVHFVTLQKLRRDHAKMPHGGLVLRSGNTGGNSHEMEFSLKLESNPEFTASVMTAYARAAARMAREGQTGAKTVFDVPLAYLSHLDGETLRRELL